MTGIKDLMWSITAWSIGIIFFMFILVFIYQLGDEYILTNVDSVSTGVIAQTGTSTTMGNYIHSLPVQYRALNIPFDLIFLAFLIGALLTSIYAASKVQEDGWWSFFGGLTLGMLLLLLISSYVAVIKNWLVLNLFDNFLGMSIQSMPFFYWWVQNMGIFNFMWAILLIIVNKMNFSYSREYDADTSQVINTGEFQK